MVTTTTFAGLETKLTVSNAGTGAGLPGNTVQTKTSYRDAQGRLERVVDTEGNVLRYEYDALGNVVKTDAGGVITTLAYDLRGRKTRIDEAASGTTRFFYNALGELVRQIDQKGQVVTLDYDRLGRLVRRDIDGGEAAVWRYDGCPMGIGKLCDVSAAGPQRYMRTHRYDALGRDTSTTVAFEGAGELTTSVAFDPNTARVARFTYPTGFAVGYDYSPSGALQRVRAAEGNALLWRADRVDQFGRVIESTLGNGLTTTRSYDPGDGRLVGLSTGAGGAIQNLQYQFDPIGNLLSRRDDSAAVGTIERFSYDALNRLREWTVSGAALGGQIDTQSASYSPIGNILTKSDAGRYIYGAQSPSGRTLPHALVALIGPQGAQFSYDENGNMLSGAARRFEYTAGNLVRAVSRGENGIEYLYGPEQQRIRQVVSSPAGTATTYYLNGLDSLGLTYEREQRSGGTVEHRHYLSAAGSVFGILNIKTKTIEGAGAGGQASPPRTELRYLHRDALGSVGAITDGAGELVERLAYDPWGKRRFPSRQADPQGGLGAQTGERTSARGFTLHEHLDEVGLVHMNARLYDPLLGRFTAADAIVDGPLDLQGYNRYSYGQNNRLAGADPSGNSFWSGLNPFSSRNLDVLFNTLANPFSAHQVHALIHRDPGIQIGDQTVQRYPVVGQIAQVAVVAVVSYFTFGTGAVAAGAISGPWAVAAIAGAAGASAALTTNALGGDSSDYWRAGLISAATTAAFYGVGAATGGFTGIEGAVIKIGAHALVGCASAAASGGECAHGAVAAAIGKGVSFGLGAVFNQPDGSKWLAHQKVIGFIATSVAGGTASALSGGKFANGAMTAAFGYLLNQMARGGVAGAAARGGPVGGVRQADIGLVFKGIAEALVIDCRYC